MPYADIDDRRAMLRRVAARRRTQGLCTSCNQKARPNRRTCQSCADAATIYRREKRQREARDRR